MDHISNMELHVWGKSSISIIDPESRAAAWLLCLHLAPQDVAFKIVPSSNTNIAVTNKLPVLIVRRSGVSQKYEGFSCISSFVSENYPSDTKFIPNGKLSSLELLANIAFTTYLSRTFHYINQYNLYVNSKNYELYTRKLFLKYLPFPMMYNQPLKFHEQACEQVQIVGLGVNQTLLFSFASEKEVADTELVHCDSDEDEDEVAISAMHEKVILTKEKNKALLRETKNTLRCLRLLDGYVSHVVGLFKELNEEAPVEFAHLFRPKKISSSELLLYSYFYSLTSIALPDRFVARYLETKFPAFWRFANTITEALNLTLKREHFRDAQGAEVPSLWNEVNYMLGLYKY
ncbi:sorting and assembly machinery component 37 [Metschnikowia aff. pulcherrima]|uniref:Sorting and assembly machinery component 37 n=1 Tax=Metschnikowia aff. pulcherrima TaxID=2163413 RepID=A0A4P6XPJ4_9ASCO|nr:sorting and assembly machinery component 37 [Metschnikowia aff. pulcherrima]